MQKGIAKPTMAGWAWNGGATNIRVRRMRLGAGMQRNLALTAGATQN